MKMKYTLLFTTILALSLLTCRDKGTDPPPLPTHPNYVWTKDTISYPGSFQTNMRGMYGISSSNVYIVGQTDIGKGKMYHYNGNAWAPVKLTTAEGGNIPGGFQLTEIHGSSPNDIWAVGEEGHYVAMQYSDSSFVIHFDGRLWSKVNIPKRKGLLSVCVAGPNQVFAGSADGVIYRYDGTNWILYDLQSEIFLTSIAAVSIDDAYVIGRREDKAIPIDSSGYFLYHFDGNNWQIMDSVMEIPGAPPAKFGANVYLMDGILYTSGSNIYRRDGNQWTKLVNAEVANISQSNPQNIVAVGSEVVHYNGYDWKKYAELYPIYGFDCYTDGKEVFIVGNDNYRTVITHGK